MIELIVCRLECLLLYLWYPLREKTGNCFGIKEHILIIKMIHDIEDRL